MFANNYEERWFLSARLSTKISHAPLRRRVPSLALTRCCNGLSQIAGCEKVPYVNRPWARALAGVSWRSSIAYSWTSLAAKCWDVQTKQLEQQQVIRNEVPLHFSILPGPVRVHRSWGGCKDPSFSFHEAPVQQRPGLRLAFVLLQPDAKSIEINGRLPLSSMGFGSGSWCTRASEDWQ